MRLLPRLLASVLFAATLFIAACDEPTDDAPSPAGPITLADTPDDLVALIDSAGLRAHIEVLASDAFEGRGTGTAGEQMTIDYISAQMQTAGLEPGAADGTFFQPVPLLGSTPVTVGNMALVPDDGEPVLLDFVSQFIASTDHDTTAISVEGAELVFVGYGISNPGYDWDDYKGVDLAGKIMVSFVNDPPATEAEPNLFQADTLTYNGRWTYKYEEARRRGAVGALLIHTGPTAGYPFLVLSGGARGEQISLATPPENALDVKGWITQPVAEQLLSEAGLTLNEAFARSATRDFEPVPLPVRASLEMTFETRRFTGTNVIGKVTGDTTPDEAVIVTAHHDHLGVDPDREAASEDGIYNGAVDNASGVSMLLEMATAIASGPTPDRSVYFLTLSAEESGLLGAAHYAEDPVVPLVHTVANVNVDSGNLYGQTTDIVGIGAERSEMLPLLRQAAAGETMTVTPDNQPNQGLFFRSDQLAFARGGVPAVFINTGVDFVGQPEGYAAEVKASYRRERYHQPADEYTPGSMPLGGLVQQTKVATRLTYGIADSDIRPTWKPSEAFAETRARAERQADL
ncbi:MAG: M28 family peptidase [Bacteroidota bacterium]